MSPAILEVKNLRKYFPIYGGVFYQKIADVHAIENISLSLKRGQTLGLVGESGCGKSTLGKLLLRLYEPTAGSALFEGKDVFSLTGKDLLHMRRHIQMIFQDPFSCLNPRMSVEDIIQEPLDIHAIGTPQERKTRIKELLSVVGMPENSLSRYPHEFSGGQRQRIGIARALALNPKLIIADEPVSALDVSIQAQILNLLRELQRKFNLTLLFISHDLSVVEYISETIAVMYLGHIVEKAPTADLFENPQHPYTHSLLSAIPIPDPKAKKKRIVLPGDVPSPIAPPSGCPFHPRCARATQECKATMPTLERIAPGSEHWVACYHPGKE